MIFFVYTNSEHIINSFRLCVVLKKISREHFQCFFLKKDEFGLQKETILIAESGGLNKWPAGFFDESEKILYAILKNRINNRGQKY